MAEAIRSNIITTLSKNLRAAPAQRSFRNISELNLNLSTLKSRKIMLDIWKQNNRPSSIKPPAEKVNILGGSEIFYETGGGQGHVNGSVAIGTFLPLKERNQIFGFIVTSYSEYLSLSSISLYDGRIWLGGLNTISGALEVYRGGEDWKPIFRSANKDDISWFAACIRETLSSSSSSILNNLNSFLNKAAILKKPKNEIFHFLHFMTNGLFKYLKLISVNDLPFPARDLLNMQNYLEHPLNAIGTMRSPATDIITSRGCPFNCVFCSVHTIWGKTWRGRSAKNVVDEIEQLIKDYGIKQIRFQDDNISLDKKRMHEICDEIINRKLNIKWDTPNGIAIWTLDEELLRKMKKSGYYRLAPSIESGSCETIKFINKPIDYEHVNKILKLADKIGLWTVSPFIIGFPYETMEDI